MIRALILVRISTQKQAYGASLENQLKKAESLAKDKYGYKSHEIKVFEEVYTGSLKNRPVFEDLMRYAEKHAQNIERVFVFDLDRLTRSGAGFYESTKQRLQERDIHLEDVAGIIQPSKNMLEGIGGEYGADLSYRWSEFSPSEGNEINRVQQAKDEARKISLRSIPRQIDNVREGFETRQAPYGFENVKILLKERAAKKTTRKILKSEAKFVQQMFELAAQGKCTSEICEQVNDAGFQTRTFNKWNKYHTEIIGTGGGKPLTPRLLVRCLQRVSYAGFKCEKWTWGHLVKAKHPSIVSIEMWNRANSGKLKIEKTPGTLTGWKLIDPTVTVRRYNRNNPEFPFKSLIRCHECENLLKGAFSRGKSGKQFPLYFCNRSHKQVSINPTELQELLVENLEPYEFDKGLLEQWEWSIRNMWSGFENDEAELITSLKERKAEYEKKVDAISEKILLVNHDSLIKKLENDYVAFTDEVDRIESKIKKQLENRLDIDSVVKTSIETIEHLGKYIANPQYNKVLKTFWNIIFTTTPTLKELQNRTPKISPILAVKDDLKKGKNPLASPKVLSSNTLREELLRIQKEIKKISPGDS